MDYRMGVFGICRAEFVGKRLVNRLIPFQYTPEGTGNFTFTVATDHGGILKEAISDAYDRLRDDS